MGARRYYLPIANVCAFLSFPNCHQLRSVYVTLNSTRTFKALSFRKETVPEEPPAAKLSATPGVPRGPTRAGAIVLGCEPHHCQQRRAYDGRQRRRLGHV